MPQQSLGGLRLFRVFGVTVYLHWSWFIVAVIFVQMGRSLFGSLQWSAAAYLLLFTIVLLHEFGHALACRSVGGEADRIVLWPLGGTAFVNPPPRPGALLWSIAAGPLVNVVVLFISVPLLFAYRGDYSGLGRFIVYGLFLQNLGLLIFNLLPIYPLDGGQIVRALLWFVIGRVNSLAVSAWIGLVVATLGCVAALAYGGWWLALIAGFAAMQSFIGISRSRQMRAMANSPRYMGVACPECGAAPPAGTYWRCDCGQNFDAFETGAICPRCQRRSNLVACPECGRRSPFKRWQTALPLPPLPAKDEIVCTPPQVL
jgi:Zn-dependent protease